MTNLMGPPEKGPVVKVVGKGLSVIIRVESEIDRDIIRLAMGIAERRRFTVA